MVEPTATAELKQRLAAFPRLKLSEYPTPLQPARRLGDYLGRQLWLKRDDLSDPGLGGNKLRKLEFLIADAMAKGATAVITSGGAQSNHARITAAVAARLGLDCHLVLQGQPEQASTGNIMLDKIFGATLHWHPVRVVPDLEPLALELAKTLEDGGVKSYLIPVGGSTPLGELGYVNCLLELHEQFEAQGIDPAKVRIFCPAGSRGTLGGLIAAKIILNSPVRLTGISVSGRNRWLLATIPPLVDETLKLLGYNLTCSTADFEVVDTFIGEAYALPTPAGWEAIKLMGSLEGVVLDPVYTGKALAGLIGMVRDGQVAGDETLIFLHTGGSPALFAYELP